ncbi:MULTISPECIES: hypothetical protein [unclassified Prevotella]|nr:MULTISPECIES: hypothetical protein [unclassified Prevotella]NPD53900.1 hypothetical protein [Prevotella sp. PTAC]GAY28155.1 MarR family transcriptional regulator [Prevotella sp. MGM1]
MALVRSPVNDGGVAQADIIRRLFGSPTAVSEAFKPFETQYDTYLISMRI